MPEQVIVPARFNGPPASGHGGYSCGVVAGVVDAPVATVSLRSPPPLDRALELRREADGTVTALDGETLVAIGRPAQLCLDVPEPVPAAAAAAASAGNPWADGGHPFPTCFGCGPDRDPADALRLILGPVPGRDVLADTWVPDASLAGVDGRVEPRFVWAALDCPTGAAAIEPGTGAAVLGALTADPGLAPVRAGEEHVVVAWLLGREGRKSRGAAAIFDAAGTLCALAEGLWIRLADPSAMGARPLHSEA